MPVIEETPMEIVERPAQLTDLSVFDKCEISGKKVVYGRKKWKKKKNTSSL